MRTVFDQALERRDSLLSEETSILRLFDGAGDGLGGFYLDQLGSHWLVSTTGPDVPGQALKWLQEQNRTVYHKQLDRSEKNSPSHLFGPVAPQVFSARENGLSFELSFESGYSQGIFPDQRLNRLRVQERGSSSDTVLNTFAYTGAFSVCAASSGATTTTLDLSRPYLDWARRNFRLNQLEPDNHHFCKGDTFHWLRRFGKQGRMFTGIVLDPPTFARDHKGKVFRIEKDYGRLIELAKGCLAPSGWILACTNYRKMGAAAFESVILDSVGKNFKVSQQLMPREFTESQYLKSVWLER